MFDPELTRRLADLGARIDARRAELRDRGEFGDVHAAAFAEVDARHTALAESMEKAIATGDLVGAAVTELRRDVDALIDGFEHMLFRVDSQAQRRRSD